MERFLGLVFGRVEVGLDGKDGECVVIFVMRCVLGSIHFKVAVGLVGINGSSRDVDVCLLSHVIGLYWNKLMKS